MNLDGSEAREIVAGDAWFISILGKRLYYTDFMGNKKIYSVLSDGSEPKLFIP